MLLQNLYIQLIALPGYLFGVAFMDVVGRKRLQLFGFAGEAVVFAIMAAFLVSKRTTPPSTPSPIPC